MAQPTANTRSTRWGVPRITPRTQQQRTKAAVAPPTRLEDATRHTREGTERTGGRCRLPPESPLRAPTNPAHGAGDARRQRITGPHVNREEVHRTRAWTGAGKTGPGHRYLTGRRKQALGTHANAEGRMADLSKIVGDLIASGKEGDHWDFKCEVHAKVGDLIKDIISLANSTRHAGDRYIIYGVDDTGTVLGLKGAAHPTQADIVDTLSNAGFAGGVYPDIYLHEIELQDQRLDILVIKDRPEKPYYLQKRYHKYGVTLNPGTVYSRVRDSNTPSDQVASPHDIVQMWRERFGLDQTPLQRVQNYLLNRNSWTETSEDVWYHTQFPEFTICPTEEEPRAVQGGENWVRAAASPEAWVHSFKLCFHQTVLADVCCIRYDEMRCITSAPRPKTIDSSKNLWFFSLCADTLKFRFLQFLTHRAKDELLKNGLSDRMGCAMPVAFFVSEGEQHAFIAELKCNAVTVEERHEDICGQNEPMVSEQDRKINAFSRAVIEQLSKWRAARP